MYCDWSNYCNTVFQGQDWPQKHGIVAVNTLGDGMVHKVNAFSYDILLYNKQNPYFFLISSVTWIVTLIPVWSEEFILRQN